MYQVCKALLKEAVLQYSRLIKAEAVALNLGFVTRMVIRNHGQIKAATSLDGKTA